MKVQYGGLCVHAAVGLYVVVVIVVNFNRS